MSRTFFIDLDGVVLSSEQRATYAENRVATWMQPFAPLLSEQKREDIQKALFYSEAGFYEETHFFFDTLLHERMIEQLDFLLQHGKFIGLSSRLEEHRQATAASLHNLGVYSFFLDLVLKTEGFRWTKTAQWKAWMVDTLAGMRGHALNCSPVFFIDDDEACRKAVAELKRPFPIHCFASVAQACEFIQKDTSEKP